MADQTVYEGTPGWESIRQLTKEWLESRFGSQGDASDLVVTWNPGDGTGHQAEISLGR